MGEEVEQEKSHWDSVKKKFKEIVSAEVRRGVEKWSW